MHYVLHAIDRLWNTNPNFNFSMNASLYFWLWYKCFLTKMLFFLWCKCPMQGCKVYSWWFQCMHSNHDVNVSLQRYGCKNLTMQMPPSGYAIMQMLWRKHNLFKNSLCFQIEASSAPEIKIFWKLDLLFLKSHILLT